MCLLSELDWQEVSLENNWITSHIPAKPLQAHYITVTQFQYILTISIAWNVRQTKQALIYVNLHISHLLCPQQRFKLQISLNYDNI